MNAMTTHVDDEPAEQQQDPADARQVGGVDDRRQRELRDLGHPDDHQPEDRPTALHVHGRPVVDVDLPDVVQGHLQARRTPSSPTTVRWRDRRSAPRCCRRATSGRWPAARRAPGCRRVHRRRSRCCRSSLPSSTKPRIVVATSSNGKIDRNPKNDSNDALWPDLCRRQPSSVSTTTSIAVLRARHAITRSLVVHAISASPSRTASAPDR